MKYFKWETLARDTRTGRIEVTDARCFIETVYLSQDKEDGDWETILLLDDEMDSLCEAWMAYRQKGKRRASKAS